jgi:hypothetical protein
VFLVFPTRSRSDIDNMLESLVDRHPSRDLRIVCGRSIPRVCAVQVDDDGPLSNSRIFSSAQKNQLPTPLRTPQRENRAKRRHLSAENICSIDVREVVHTGLIR